MIGSIAVVVAATPDSATRLSTSERSPVDLVQVYSRVPLLVALVVAVLIVWLVRRRGGKWPRS